MQQRFHADERVADAEATLAASQAAREKGMDDEAAAARVLLLNSWSNRVLAWREHMSQPTFYHTP